MPRIWLIGRSWPTPSARPVEIGPAKTAICSAASTIWGLDPVAGLNFARWREPSAAVDDQQNTATAISKA